MNILPFFDAAVPSRLLKETRGESGGEDEAEGTLGSNDMEGEG